MFIKLFKIIKKIIFSFLVLYGLNMIVGNINIFIPINIYTVGTISLLGVPGLLSLICIYFIIN